MAQELKVGDKVVTTRYIPGIEAIVTKIDGNDVECEILEPITKLNTTVNSVRKLE